MWIASITRQTQYSDPASEPLQIYCGWTSKHSIQWNFLGLPIMRAFVWSLEGFAMVLNDDPQIQLDDNNRRYPRTSRPQFPNIGETGRKKVQNQPFGNGMKPNSSPMVASQQAASFASSGVVPTPHPEPPHPPPPTPSRLTILAHIYPPSRTTPTATLKQPWYLCRKGEPYTNAAHAGASSSLSATDDPWATSRETSILLDPRINFP